MADSITQITQSTVIHIKNSPYKKGWKRWFWHKKKAMLVGKAGIQPPFTYINHIQNCQQDTTLIDRSELQIGDSCLIKFTNRDALEFATIVGLTINGSFMFLSNTGELILNGHIDEFIIISNNTRISKLARPNLCHAQTPEELDVIEKIFYLKALNQILKDIANPQIGISEKTFIKCHQLIFGQIYDWAGVYRSLPHEEVVIGHRNYPTMDPTSVSTEIQKYFHALPNPLLRSAANSTHNLAIVITDIHTKLAWIHPFKDGNGRSIRLFCQIVALKWQHYLHWENITGKQKRYYHYTVRKAVNGNQAQLLHLIAHNLEKIT